MIVVAKIILENTLLRSGVVESSRELGLKKTQTEKAAGRTSTLLSAKICWAEGEAMAFVRNISEMGALLECVASLATNESVILRREGLEVNGNVVWSRDGAYGIKFLTAVDPSVWISEQTPSKVAATPASSLKQLIEQGEDVSSLIDKRLSEEIAYAGRLLETVGDTFAKDAVLCHRYPTQLQNLSITIQMLAEFSDVLSASNKLSAVENRVTGPAKVRILR